jgi:hypothetical protein
MLGNEGTSLPLASSLIFLPAPRILFDFAFSEIYGCAAFHIPSHDDARTQSFQRPETFSSSFRIVSHVECGARDRWLGRGFEGMIDTVFVS